MSEIARLFATIGADISGLTSGLSSVRGMLHSTAMDMQMTGMSLSMGLTLPLAALGKASFDAATDLDTQMRNIQSISRQTDVEIAALSSRFVKMSTDLTMTRDSAEKLAEGFYFIQSSGFAGADGITVLEVATKAASAGLSDTKTAAQAILATLNAYGLEAESAAHVSDVLFKTVDLGVLTFDDLASQLGDVVNTSATVGVSIEEVGAAIAQMTRKGVSSAESVTALNQLMLQFISPSDKMKKTAAEMGIELSVASLRSKGLAGALQEILDKGGGPDAFLRLFGDNVRALKGALSIAGGGMGDFTAMMDEFGNVTGRTEEAFATQTKSFSAQFDNLKNKGTAALISLGAVLVPILLQFVDALTPVIDGLKNINLEWLRWAVVIGGVAAALGPVMMFVGTLATLLGFLLSPVGLVIVAIGVLGAAWETNFGGMRDIVTQLFDVFTQSGGLADPINGIVGVLVSLGQGDIAAQVVGISVAFQNLGGAILASLPQIQGAALMILNALVGSLQGAWPQINANLVSIMQSVSTGLNTLAQFWRDHGTEIIAILTFVGSMLVATVTGIMTLFTGIVAAALLLLQGDWVGALNTLGATLESFFNTILAVVGTNMESLRASWAGVWDLLVIIVTQSWTNMKDAAAAKMMEMTGGIQTWIINTINWLKAQYNTFVAIGSQWFEGIKQGILMKVTELRDAVVGSILAVVSAARDALGISSPSQIGIEYGNYWMQGLGIGLLQGAAGAANAMRNATAGLTPNFAGGSSFVSSGGAPGFNPQDMQMKIEIPIMLDGEMVGRGSYEGLVREVRNRGMQFAEVSG